jgi:hypothetical protein
MINQDGRGTLAWTSSLISYLVGVVMVIAAAWTFFAPWFSAHNFMDLKLERGSCWLAILAVIACGAIYAGIRPSGTGRVSRILWRCILLCAFLLIFFGELFSSNLFVYWKVRAIPPNVWALMASNLQKAGEMAADDGGRPVHWHELPVSLRQLGSMDDYLGVGAGWGPNNVVGSDFRADIEFGNKLRVWGLFVASDKVTQDQYTSTCVRAVNVAPGAVFYLSLSP